MATRSLPYKQYRQLFRFHTWPGIKVESHLGSQFEIDTTGDLPFLSAQGLMGGPGVPCPHRTGDSQRLAQPGKHRSRLRPPPGPHTALKSAHSPNTKKALDGRRKPPQPALRLPCGTRYRATDIAMPTPCHSQQGVKGAHLAPLSRSLCSGVAPSHRTSHNERVPPLPSANRSQQSHGAVKHLKDA